VGQGLVRLVGIMPGLQIRGLAACGADGVERAGLTRPDVVLVDAELPGETAPRTIRQLRRGLPAARIVALGLYPDRRAAMLAAGAHAFALKDAGFEALRAAICPDAAAAQASARAATQPAAAATAAAAATGTPSATAPTSAPAAAPHPSTDLDRTVESESASARTPGSILR
jgi:DNA-binding NarL/FixJ family response regulator